jgi:hypothetical protein
MRLGTEVLLVREPANENDPSAILVVFPNGAEVGYVPREDAVDLAPLLDDGYKYQAHIDVINPAEAGKLPEVQAFFFPPNSTGPEAESAHVATVAPARVQTSRFAANGETGVGQKTAGCALRSGTGCLVVLFSLVILVGVLRLLGIAS